MRKILIRIIGMVFVGILLVHVTFLTMRGWRFWDLPSFVIGVAGLFLLFGGNMGRLLASLACLCLAITWLMHMLGIMLTSAQSATELVAKQGFRYHAAFLVIFGVFYAFLVAPGTRSVYRTGREMVSGKQLAKPVLLTAGLLTFAMAAIFLYLGIAWSPMSIWGAWSAIWAIAGIVCFRVWYVLRRAERVKSAGDREISGS